MAISTKDISSKVKVCFAPDKDPDLESNVKTLKIFLAGSIEQGRAKEWQKDLIDDLRQFEKSLLPDFDITIILFNPRRKEWDASLPQSAMNDVLRTQIIWELDHLESADVICLYLDPDSKSPISLLEMGLHMQSGKMLVCCPEGFYRKANIDITCDHYGVKVHHLYEDFLNALKDRILEARQR